MKFFSAAALIPSNQISPICAYPVVVLIAHQYCELLSRSERYLRMQSISQLIRSNNTLINDDSLIAPTNPLLYNSRHKLV